MQLMRGCGGSELVKAEECSSTTSVTTLGRMNKRTSGYEGLQWPDWVAGSREGRPLTIQEKFSSWEAHDGEKEV